MSIWVPPKDPARLLLVISSKIMLLSDNIFSTAGLKTTLLGVENLTTKFLVSSFSISTLTFLSAGSIKGSICSDLTRLAIFTFWSIYLLCLSDLDT